MTTSRPLAASLALAACATALVGCGEQSSDSSTQPSAATGAASCSYASSGEEPAKTVDPPSGSNVADQGTATVTWTLDGKPVTFTLQRAKTPCATNNFVSLSQQGWFTGTSCHRLTDQGIFVLQCGDPTGTGSAGPGYAFNDELETAKAFAKADYPGTVTYPKGTVAMANAGPGTNGSQIFIVYQDSPLEPNYTAFGTIDEAGLKAVQEIAAQGVAADGTKPNAPAKITEVTLG